MEYAHRPNSIGLGEYEAGTLSASRVSGQSSRRALPASGTAAFHLGSRLRTQGRLTGEGGIIPAGVPMSNAEPAAANIRRPTVFISWSGERSEKIGAAFRRWLPHVIMGIDFYFTPKDIRNGSRWPQELATHLETAVSGILIVMPENLAAPWLQYEAGALSKKVDVKVVPLLFELKPKDVERQPLAVFQAAVYGEAKMREILEDIRGSLPFQLDPEVVKGSFDAFWPKLDADVQAALKAPPEDAAPSRSGEDMIEEILDVVRQLARDLQNQWPWSPRRTVGEVQPLRDVQETPLIRTVQEYTRWWESLPLKAKAMLWAIERGYPQTDIAAELTPEGRRALEESGRRLAKFRDEHEASSHKDSKDQ